MWTLRAKQRGVSLCAKGWGQGTKEEDRDGTSGILVTVMLSRYNRDPTCHDVGRCGGNWANSLSRRKPLRKSLDDGLRPARCSDVPLQCDVIMWTGKRDEVLPSWKTFQGKCPAGKSGELEHLPGTNQQRAESAGLHQPPRIQPHQIQVPCVQLNGLLPSP